jgi:hypothetical protein
MMYVGHFSFDASESAPRDAGDGSFTCLAEADSVEAAVEKFKDYIISLDDSFEGFESVGNIFLDAVIEVNEIPEQGVLTRFEERMPEGLGTIYTTLPDAPPGSCIAYDWGKEGEDVEAEEERTVEPFIFEE